MRNRMVYWNEKKKILILRRRPPSAFIYDAVIKCFYVIEYLKYSYLPDWNVWLKKKKKTHVIYCTKNTFRIILPRIKN